MRKIVLTAVGLLMISCQSLIWENRMDCPSLLRFDIENANAFDGVNPVLVEAYSQAEETLLTADTTIVNNIQDQSFSLKVKKSDAVMGYGVMGFEGARREGHFRWVVDQGADFVPLYRFAYEKVSTWEESVLVPVEFVKDFTRVTVRFTDYDRLGNAGDRFPFRLCVTANTAGIDVSTGIPVKGDFRYEPLEEDAGTFRFIVPRQADHSLTLDLNGISETGQESSFNLWTLLQAQTDFSWEAKNLADVYIEFDYTKALFNISVAGWDQVNNRVLEF
jgi:hypothetical protein